MIKSFFFSSFDHSKPSFCSLLFFITEFLIVKVLLLASFSRHIFRVKSYVIITQPLFSYAWIVIEIIFCLLKVIAISIKYVVASVIS